MSDQDVTSADLSTVDSASVVDADGNTVYYGYTPLGEGVGYSNGLTYTVESGGEQPANSFRFPPPITGASTQAYFDGYGWFVGVTYSPQLTQVVVEGAKLEITQQYDAKMKALTAKYNELESDTFLRQELDARAYKVTGTPSPFLTSLASSQNIALDTLVNEILANSEVYGQELGTLLGEYKLAIANIQPSQVVVTKENIQLIFGLTS